MPLGAKLQLRNHFFGCGLRFNLLVRRASFGEAGSGNQCADGHSANREPYGLLGKAEQQAHWSGGIHVSGCRDGAEQFDGLVEQRSF